MNTNYENYKYVVEDTETGNYVLYYGESRKEAIQTIKDNQDCNLDLYEDGKLVWCSTIHNIDELDNFEKIDY